MKWSSEIRVDPNPTISKAQDLLELLRRPRVQLALKEAGQVRQGLQRREHDKEDFHLQHRQQGINSKFDVSGPGAQAEDSLGLTFEVVRRSGVKISWTGRSPGDDQEEEWGEQRRQEVRLDSVWG